MGGNNPELSVRCNRFEADDNEHADLAWASLATEIFPFTYCIPIYPYSLCLTFNFPWGDLRDQGTSDCDNDDRFAAGNKWITNNFDDPALINCLGRDKDIFVEQTLLPFTYYHHKSDADNNLKVKPECASAWWAPTFRKQCTTDEDEVTSCDPGTIALRIAPPDSQQNVQEYIDTLLERKNEYLNTLEQKQNDMDSIRALLDNGNPGAVLDSVLNMSFGLSTKNAILHRNSPLSDDVLMAVMLEDVY